MRSRNLIMILTLLTCAYSCSSEKTEIEANPRSAINIGEEHNSGLDYVLSTLNSQNNRSFNVTGIAKNNVSSLEVAKTSYEYIETVKPNMVTSLEKNNLITEMSTQLEYLRDDLSTTGVMNRWDLTVNEAMDNTQTLSFLEQNAIYDIQQMFTDAYSKTRTKSEMFNFINGNLDKFKLTYQAIYNPQNELFYGLVQIATSSNDYWNNAQKTTANDKDSITTLGSDPWIVQVDCIGYILAWVQAVDEDNKKPGGITPEGQWGRIEKGLYGALNFSVGGALGRKF